MTEHDPDPSLRTYRRSRRGLPETSRAVVPCSSLSTVTPGQHLRRRSCVSGSGNPDPHGLGRALDDVVQEWTRGSLAPEVSMGLLVGSPRTPLNSGITAPKGRAKANISCWRSSGHARPGHAGSNALVGGTGLAYAAELSRGAATREVGAEGWLTCSRWHTAACRPQRGRQPRESPRAPDHSVRAPSSRDPARREMCVSRCFAPVSLGYQRIPLQAV